MAPRATRLWISGFKSLRDVELPLDGLTVLIGDNGSGKSSILEVLELLRSTTHEGHASRVASTHGGVARLRENGAERLSICVEITDGHRRHRYRQTWSDPTASQPDEQIIEDIDRVYDKGTEIAVRDAASLTMSVRGSALPIDRSDSLIFAGATHEPVIAAIAAALRGFEIHLPFQVTAPWAMNTPSSRSPRGIGLVEPTDRLERFGSNLVNAYHALKNDFGVDHWSDTLEYIRLGLSDDIRDVRLEAIPGGGHIALSLETRQQGHVPAFAMADGVLSYLAFVAMYRLDRRRTLLAFDEPELHLHPGLLGRVLGMFEAMAEQYPVVLATHSDRLLDGLLDPVRSVVVTELDRERRTRLRHLDATALSKWLEDYRGLGELRADGELVSVLAEAVSPPSDTALAPSAEPLIR